MTSFRLRNADSISRKMSCGTSAAKNSCEQDPTGVRETCYCAWDMCNGAVSVTGAGVLMLMLISSAALTMML